MRSKFLGISVRRQSLYFLKQSNILKCRRLSGISNIQSIVDSTKTLKLSPNDSHSTSSPKPRQPPTSTTQKSEESDDLSMIRDSVQALCERFPGTYWQRCDRERAYPKEFVKALSDAGYLSILVPEKYGGGGLGLQEATAVLEEIHRSGGNAGACHAQMYTMSSILKSGSEAQKAHWLPRIASGDVRLQAFGVTEPTSGSDTLNLRTVARKKGSSYVINGQKIWTSRAEHSDLMLLLARTTPRDRVKKHTDGLSLFLVDMKDALEKQTIKIRPIRAMVNHSTTEVFFEDMEVPEENLLGKEGSGFKSIMQSMNAERTLIASECIGDARFFVERAVEYGNGRMVFDRPITSNQGIQFPLARARIHTESAALMVQSAARLIDEGSQCASQANMAKFLAARRLGNPRRRACKHSAGSRSPRSTTLSVNSARRHCTKWHQYRIISVCRTLGSMCVTCQSHT
eukprot:536026_1